MNSHFLPAQRYEQYHISSSRHLLRLVQLQHHNLKLSSCSFLFLLSLLSYPAPTSLPLRSLKMEQPLRGEVALEAERSLILEHLLWVKCHSHSRLAHHQLSLGLLANSLLLFLHQDRGGWSVLMPSYSLLMIEERKATLKSESRKFSFSCESFLYSTSMQLAPLCHSPSSDLAWTGPPLH
jgi:hypothetical protein